MLQKIKNTTKKLNKIKKEHNIKAPSPQEMMMLFSDTTVKNSYTAQLNQASTLYQSIRPIRYNEVFSVQLLTHQMY